MKKLRIKTLNKIYILVAAVVALLFNQVNLNAVSYRLEQVIGGPDCSHTSYKTGLGHVNHIECKVFAPTIDEFISNEGKPIINGAFDAIHDEMSAGTSQPYLRVWFNNKWYTLGHDEELAADGNGWKLDLSNIKDKLPEGKYEVKAESKDSKEGSLLKSSKVFDLSYSSGSSTPDNPGGGNDLGPGANSGGMVPKPGSVNSQSGSKNTDNSQNIISKALSYTGQNIVAILLVAATVTAGSSLILFVFKKKQKKNKTEDKNM